MSEVVCHTAQFTRGCHTLRAAGSGEKKVLGYPTNQHHFTNTKVKPAGRRKVYVANALILKSTDDYCI